MTREEQVEICAGCKQHKFDLNKGIVCGKTGELGDKGNECPDYESTGKSTSVTENLRNEPAPISGFLKFYVYWSLPIGAVLTLIFTFIGFDSTLWKMNMFLPLGDIVIAVIYCILCVYVMIAFINCRTDAVFMAKYQLIMMAVSNVLVILAAEPVTHTYTSLLWFVVFFAYVTFSNDIKERIPKETRKLTKFSKIFLPVSLCVPIVCFVLGVGEIVFGGRFFASAEDKIEAYCQAMIEELPIDELHSVMVDGNTVVLGSNVDLGVMTDLDEEYFSLVSREVSLMSMEYDEEFDEFLKLCVEAGYNIEYKYIDAVNNVNVSSVLTPEMISDVITSGYNYAITDAAWDEFLNLYNSNLPGYYFDDCYLQSVSVDSDNGVVRYDLELTNMPAATLMDLTSDELKDHMLSIFNDVFDYLTTLAQVSGFDIEYNFTADTSTAWESTVTISFDEVSKYDSFE